jgi:hypothetical protein
LSPHNHSVACDHEDTHEKKRGEQAVENRRPIERLDRADVQVIEDNGDGHGDDEDDVKAAGAQQALIQALPPREGLRKRIGRGPGQRGNRKESRADDAKGEKSGREVAGERSKRFGGLARRFDLSHPGFMKRQPGRQNDEIHDEIRGKGPGGDIDSAVRELGQSGSPPIREFFVSARFLFLHFERALPVK